MRIAAAIMIGDLGAAKPRVRLGCAPLGPSSRGLGFFGSYILLSFGTDGVAVSRYLGMVGAVLTIGDRVRTAILLMLVGAAGATSAMVAYGLQPPDV